MTNEMQQEIQTRFSSEYYQFKTQVDAASLSTTTTSQADNMTAAGAGGGLAGGLAALAHYFQFLEDNTISERVAQDENLQM